MELSEPQKETERNARKCWEQEDTVEVQGGRLTGGCEGLADAERRVGRGVRLQGNVINIRETKEGQ